MRCSQNGGREQHVNSEERNRRQTRHRQKEIERQTQREGEHQDLLEDRKKTEAKGGKEHREHTPREREKKDQRVVCLPVSSWVPWDQP